MQYRQLWMKMWQTKFAMMNTTIINVTLMEEIAVQPIFLAQMVADIISHNYITQSQQVLSKKLPSVVTVL